MGCRRNGMDEDREYVARVKGGEAEAFSHLVNKYRKPILNLIYRYTGRADEAEDLAQEVFLRAFRGLAHFKAQAKFFTWLYRIAVNLCLRVRQRSSRFIFQSLDREDETGMTGEKGQGPDEPQKELERQELQDKVRQAVMDLPDDQRIAVLLYRYHDLSYEDIAQVLNISMPAVKSRLHRARKALKDSLEQYVLN
jgi:RNA polymerase sigma-70 factor (ECF subfamily)